MEIHIDTKKDSDEEIKRAIRMLQAYVGEVVGGQSSEHSGLGSDSQNAEVSPGAFNMFGEDSSSQGSVFGSQGSDSQNSDKSLEIKEEKEETDEPKIQFIDY